MEYLFSKKRIKGRDLRLSQKGDYDSNLRLLACCALDPATGDYMDTDQAFTLLDEMNLEDQDAEVEKFFKMVEAAKVSAVPLATNGR